MTPLLLLLCVGGFCTVRLSRLRQFTLSETKVNSTEAQTNCQKNYSDLVTVHNQEDYEQLIQLMTSDKIDRAWIGLQRTQPSLVWSNGDPVNDTAWSPPNYTNPNCVAINPNVTWEICFQEKNVMCYKKESFHLINETNTWEQALDYCNKNYHGLLRLESEADHKIVEQKLSRSVKLVPGPVWVGLRQSRLFGFWLWTNGMPVQWSNWEGYRQPKQPLSNHCGAMSTWRSRSPRWKDECDYTSQNTA
ncbi:macrophage mannose receptor 1-like [Oncorhynchus keta]|uniref:macrophage mannose receptor 1-like n=1 Tax=Oncorhynchus keta TaxID=8018 RepID=UPI0015F85022|nr:macrophage mannose receptor 1-like [Oncorhynchus keta]